MSNLIINQGISLRFHVIWLIFTLLVFYAQKILRQWLQLAWLRHHENQALISKLENMVNYDALTGIANRRAMDHYLASLSQTEKPFSVILLDVDYFKKYNDFYGHQQGDSCLMRIASLLQKSVRTPEDMVARYGGEEFLLILIDAKTSDAEQVAERILTAVNEEQIPHAESNTADHVTVSMGIATRSASIDVAPLIQQADQKLYLAKSSGRNQWK